MSGDNNRNTRDVDILVRLRIPEDWDYPRAMHELFVCISFGQPRLFAVPERIMSRPVGPISEP